MNPIENFVGEHKVRNPDGSIVFYRKGDVVSSKGKTYVAIRDNVSKFSPEHGPRGGWEPFSNSSVINFTNSDVAPETPNEGDHWFDSSKGILYYFVSDKDTNQWVEV